MTEYKWFELVKTGKLTQEHINQWLSKGNSIDEQDNYGWTALRLACDKGHYEILRLLIERGADVNQQNIYGETVLIKACYKGHYEIIKLLIEKGVDVDIQCMWGQTALMWACYKGYYEIAKLFIENGANPYLLNNKNNFYAYDYADDNIKQLFKNNCLYFINKMMKKIIKDKINNKEILNIKRINISLNKLI